jgi:glycogen debranching enzyme
MPESSAYAVDQATPLLGAETVNLVSGSSFVVCSLDGWIRAGGLQGYYSGDSRVLSSLVLHVDGSRPVPLTEEVTNHSIRVVSIVGDPSRPSFLIRHQLVLAEALTLSIEVENLSSEPQSVRMELTATADFADIFEVKRGDRAREGFVGSGPSQGDLVLSFESGDFRRGLRVSCNCDYHVLRDGIEIPLDLGPRESATVVQELIAEGARYVPLHQRRVDRAAPSIRLPDDLARSRPALRRILERSAADVDSLRMVDPLQPDHPVIAAGSPWFLALFGRDSLITAWETIHLDGDLTLNVLEALAKRQGRDLVSGTDEEPGRILHEVRSGDAVRRPSGWGSTYYGSVDATPLFIMVLAESFRRGLDRSRVEALIPVAERCLEWVNVFGDNDGDGLIEYPGNAEGQGLDNQAWKDSSDAVRHHDGSLAEGPIAMVEVQGYLHRALVDLAELRDAFGHPNGDLLRKRAESLQQQIHDQFWMEEESTFAIALDGHKKQVRGVASNAGHLLWTKTAYQAAGERVAARFLEPDLFSGFGIRTLSSSNPGYNPMSYHCGSVWPHDTALIAEGMFAYGAKDEGAQVVEALLAAADEQSGRLPELFGGFDRERFSRPVPYPASCSPQAWAAGAPLLLARFLS